MSAKPFLTGQEVQIKEDSIVVSKTDLRGIVTYVNDEFVKLSGLSREQLIGKNHNFNRHPDVPKEVFADLWSTVQSGRPWTHIIKSRTSHGHHVWFRANITPITRNGQIVEYMSVRTKPTAAEIAETQKLFDDVNSGAISLERKGIKRLWHAIVNTSVRTRIYGAVGLTAVFQILAAVALRQGIEPSTVATTLGVTGIFSVLFGLVITNSAIKPLAYAAQKLKQVTEGQYFDWINTDRNDEIGELLRAIKSVQIQLGFEMTDTRDSALRATRVKTALDCVETGVMIVDDNDKIIYTNNALEHLFRNAEADIRCDLPEFNASGLVGRDLSIFNRPTELKSGSLGAVKGEFSLGKRVFSIAASPVVDESRQRVGRVIEWVDRTQQVNTEQEVQKIVMRAQQGDLSGRLPLPSDEGFILSLSEAINDLLEVNEAVVDDTNRILRLLAAGDLTQSVSGNYQGSFDELKTNINTTISRLTDIIARIKHSSDAVSAGVKEIAQGNNDLSLRTQAQASTLENSASSIQTMTDAVRVSAENSGKADELALEAREKALKGGEVISQTIDAMQDMEVASGKISEIINVVDEIAFQTNLLALNAAVEAAHAGDQGRGFAVVASEVRALAQRSAEAATEVKELIEDSVKKVVGGSDLAKESGHTLEEIIAETQRVSSLISDVSQAGREQAIGIEQVSAAMGELEQTTQENTALVELTAVASENLQEQASDLAELVSFFTVDDRKNERQSVGARLHGLSRKVEPA